MADSRDSVELRGMVPRHIIDVLDAVAQAQRKSRVDIWNEILSAWARDKVHESILVQRLTRGNGT